MINKSQVVLFDGVCLFCEGWVNFVIDNLANEKIYFIQLQKVELTSLSNQIIEKFGGESDSILCITENGTLKLKSDASLHVMSSLRFPFGIMSKILMLVPRFVRNFVYDFIGRRRYNIWGKRDYCIVPAGERAKNFIINIDEMPNELAEKCDAYFKFI